MNTFTRTFWRPKNICVETRAPFLPPPPRRHASEFDLQIPHRSGRIRFYYQTKICVFFPLLKTFSIRFPGSIVHLFSFWSWEFVHYTIFRFRLLGSSVARCSELGAIHRTRTRSQGEGTTGPSSVPRPAEAALLRVGPAASHGVCPGGPDYTELHAGESFSRRARPF